MYDNILYKYNLNMGLGLTMVYDNNYCCKKKKKCLTVENLKWFKWNNSTTEYHTSGDFPIRIYATIIIYTVLYNTYIRM